MAQYVKAQKTDKVLGLQSSRQNGKIKNTSRQVWSTLLGA